MTREEGKEFANALKNNYTIDFDKIPDFCDLVISALEKNESAEEWYKLLCEKWDSAENKGEWIPVSERLPEEKNKNYMATIVDWFTKERFIDIVDYDYLSLEEVIAWMPLPEPYKAESEDK